MTRELQEKLFTKYPEIFKDRKQPIRLSNMAFGIECDNGWFQLLDDLCGQLMTSGDGIPHATQVKEKYGGLCFYVDLARDKNYRLIGDAEKASFFICEVCGATGALREKKLRWLKTVCDAHATELGYDYGEFTK